MVPALLEGVAEELVAGVDGHDHSGREDHDGHQHEHEHEPVQSHKDHGMQHGGHSHHEHHGQDFLKRFWISIIVTIPLLLLSHSIQQWFGFNLKFNGDNYLLLLLGSFIYIYGGKPFLVGAISEIKRNAIGMMTLVAIAITVAYLYSTAVMLGFQGMDFFWELATLIDIMLLGH